MPLAAGFLNCTTVFQLFMHLNLLNGMLAEATTAAVSSAPTDSALPPTQSIFKSQIVLFGLMFVMMYFIMIRPQQLRAKQQKKLLEALKSGDRVMTSSGFIGIVISVKDKAVPPTVTIRSSDAKFEVTKASVTEILEAGTTTES